MEEKVLNIKETLQIIRKRFNIILLIGIIAGAAGFYLTTKMQSNYISTLKIFVGENGVSGTYTTEELKVYKDNINYYIEVFRTDDFYKEAISKSGLKRSPEQVGSCLKITPVGENAPLIEMEYVDLDQEASMKMINVISQLFMDKSSKLIENTRMERIEEPKLRIQNPNKTKIVVVALALGIIVGIGLVLIWDYLDDTVKSSDELEDILGVSVIGTVPLSDNLK